MSSVSGPTASRPPPLRDTMSLRPQGFYGYAFVFARTAEIMALVAVVGLVGNFIHMMTTSRQSPAVSLVVTLVFTSFAILWTCCSWNGYSRRYLPYGATWFIDVLFLAPFATVTVLLGIPLSTTTCRDVADNNLSINVPAGGTITFTGKGQAACIKLFGVWGLLIGVCVLLGISALSAGLLQLGERQLGDAIQGARERGDFGYGSYPPQSQGQGQMELGSFRPGPPKSQGSWDSVGSLGERSQEYAGGIVGQERRGSDGYYNSRPSRQRVASPEPYRSRSPDHYRTRSPEPYRPRSPDPYRSRSPYDPRSSPYRSDSVSRSNKSSRSPALPPSVKLPAGSRNYDDGDDTWSRSNRSQS